MIFRIAFIVLAAAAISGTYYVSYHGWGRESADLDRSIRAGSGGNIIGGGRVK